MKTSRIYRMFGYTSDWGVAPWLLMGFFISFFLFFICPVFLNSEQAMQFFRYVPTINPIGVDLKQTLIYSRSWFIDKHTPYIGSNYPPFAAVFFTPLLFTDFSMAYRIITLMSLLCFIFTLLIPVLVNRTRECFSLMLFFLLTGLFSYGFHFELERGQFNVIAFLFCMLSIYIFHYHHRFRYLAYLLFSLSIQLKMFPAIFIFMFIKDWSDWKANIKRVMWIVLFNFSLFFILGYKIFIEFVQAISNMGTKPYVTICNLSVQSFVTLLTTEALERLHLEKWAWIAQYAMLMKITLLSFVVLPLLLICFKEYRQKRVGMSPYLLIVCTIGSLLIPSFSGEYKLSILPAPMILALYSVSRDKNFRLRTLSTLLVCVVSLAYTSMLFSFSNKPVLLKSNFPALMVILWSFTILAVLDNSRIGSRTSSTVGTTG